jgi:hypothetical protein
MGFIVTTLLTFLVTLTISASVAGREQTLAEAAKTEAARREGVKTPSKVYTNADAKRRERAAPATPEVPAPASDQSEDDKPPKRAIVTAVSSGGRPPAGNREGDKAPKRGSVLVATVPPRGSATARVPVVVEGELPAPQALCVSPAFFTMMAGDTRTLRLADERGRTRTGGSWTTSNAAVATIDVIADVVTVNGVGAGEATFTLNRGGLVFTGKLNVVAQGATLPNGTVLWSLGPC